MGENAKGTVLEASDSNFKIDFAKAYTGVDCLVANYEMKENGIRISYEAKGIHDNICFRFLSFRKPVLKENGTVDLGIAVSNSNGLKPDIKEISYKAHRNVMGTKDDEIIYAIDYVVKTGGEVKETFDFSLE